MIGGNHGAVLAGAALTFVGVPAGLALTGGNVDGVMTFTLAVLLAGAMLGVRRWPLTVLIFSVLSVVGLRTSFLIGSGWVWPATAAFVTLVLAGRLRAAIVVGASGLLYGFVWDGYVDKDHGLDWAVAHVGGEALLAGRRSRRGAGLPQQPALAGRGRRAAGPGRARAGAGRPAPARRGAGGHRPRPARRRLAHPRRGRRAPERRAGLVRRRARRGPRRPAAGPGRPGPGDDRPEGAGRRAARRQPDRAGGRPGRPGPAGRAGPRGRAGR